MIHALLAVTITVSTIAGVPGVAGRLDGATFVHDVPRVGVRNAPGEHDGTVDPTIPVFNGPTAVTVDRRRYPTASCCLPRSIFIADTGFEGEYFADSVTTFVRGFISPRGLAFAPDGSLFVTDSELHTVTRIAPDGLRTVVAGQPAVVVIRKITIASAPPGPGRRGVRH